MMDVIVPPRWFFVCQLLWKLFWMPIFSPSFLTFYFSAALESCEKQPFFIKCFGSLFIYWYTVSRNSNLSIILRQPVSNTVPFKLVCVVITITYRRIHNYLLLQVFSLGSHLVYSYNITDSFLFLILLDIKNAINLSFQLNTI